MVKTTNSLKRIAILLPCLLLLAGILAIAPGGAGRASAAVGADIEEELTQEISAVGDVHVTDVLKYDADWFDENGFVFEDYPSLLSRNYTQDTDQREITNFDVQVNKRKATVTVIYDIPGGAYNEGDKWILYGYGTQPADESAGEIVFEEEFTANNEITLWENMDVFLTATVKTPEGATDLEYDASKKAVTYVLPWKEASTGFWGAIEDNRPLFIAIFAVVLLLGAGMLAAHLVSRKRIPVPVRQPKEPRGTLPPLPPPPPGAPRM